MSKSNVNPIMQSILDAAMPKDRSSMVTHNGDIMNLIRKIPELENLQANYNAYGVEATFTYKPDGKTYHVMVQEFRPKKGGA